MSALLEAYITNLGKYAEGELVGETLKFPTTAEEVQSLLKRIGVDGIRYEEIFITSFDGDVLGLHEHLGEYESIDELNYLAALLSEMDQSDIEKFEAVIDAGEYTGSVKDLINLTQNLDCFDFEPGLNPIDWLVGIVGAVAFRLFIHMKSKKAKKFRRDEEYGTARWGNEKDIKPFVDSKFENNVILTGTEFLTMNTRPKIPANARNLNTCVIGSSARAKPAFGSRPSFYRLIPLSW